MLAIVLVLLSAATNAAAMVLLRKATEAEEDRPKFSFRLVWHLVRRRPVWGAGIATIVVGFALQAFALANGPLSVVQLVILMELPFTLLLAWPVLGGRLRASEWSAIAAMTVGLVVVLFSLAPRGGDPFAPNLFTWLVGLAVTTALVLALLVIGQRTGPAARTALFGVAAGVASGLIAVLVKAVVVALGGGFVAVIGTWQTWVLIAAAIAGFLLLQNALQAGRLAASQPRNYPGKSRDCSRVGHWAVPRTDPDRVVAGRGGTGRCAPGRRCGTTLLLATTGRPPAGKRTRPVNRWPLRARHTIERAKVNHR